MRINSLMSTAVISFATHCDSRRSADLMPLREDANANHCGPSTRSCSVNFRQDTRTLILQVTTSLSVMSWTSHHTCLCQRGPGSPDLGTPTLWGFFHTSAPDRSLPCCCFESGWNGGENVSAYWTMLTHSSTYYSYLAESGDVWCTAEC